MPYPGNYPLARRHPAGIALVAGLHAVFIFAFVTGLKTRSAADPLPPLQGVVLPNDPVKPVESQLTTPDLTRPVFRVDMNDPPPVPLPPEPAREGVAVDTASTESGTALPPSHEVVVRGPAIDPHSPLTQPPYPAAAIRGGEEGNLALEVLVGADGRVRDARVARSSGFPLLDQAAVDEARRHWRLRPGTRDGVPLEQWYTLKVVFHLENR
jgi:periplasmic protein TonB